MIGINPTHGVLLMIKNSEEIDYYSFVLEPSFKSDGSVHSWEILTRNVCKKNSNNEFSNEKLLPFYLLNEQERIDVFNKQLLIIPTLDPSRTEGKPISINVDSLISDYILRDRYLCDYIKQHSNITVEVNEGFHEFKKCSSMVELNSLSKLCPVWLDDFGRGFTSVKLLESFRFGCIKIDKDYFWEIENDFDFSEKLKKIKSYSDFVIVEGVEKIEQKKKVFSVDEIACQGRLWESHYYYIKC